jgi:hypothetical protein
VAVATGVVVGVVAGARDVGGSSVVGVDGSVAGGSVAAGAVIGTAPTGVASSTLSSTQSFHGWNSARTMAAAVTTRPAVARIPDRLRRRTEVSPVDMTSNVRQAPPVTERSAQSFEIVSVRVLRISYFSQEANDSRNIDPRPVTRRRL